MIKMWSPTGSSASQDSLIVLEDLFDKLEVDRQSEEEEKQTYKRDYNVIRLANLQEGTYKLRIKKISKTINITVHRGQYWDSDSFILKRNCLFENRAPLKMIKIANV